MRERLEAIWERPMSLDPSAEAARMTRDIANHLAALARRLEKRETGAGALQSRSPEAVSACALLHCVAACLPLRPSMRLMRPPR